MKKYLISLILFSQAILADPFYGETKSESASSTVELTQGDSSKRLSNKSIPSCDLSETLNRINLTEEFEDLKLVGLVKINYNFKALFKNKDNKLLILNKNDYLEAQLIEISSIDLTAVKYIHWGLTEDCAKPHQMTLRL
ncbi:pilus assembly protein PilP [Haemophilus sputorum]|uniref:Pilus assembly protein PilP n=1 Tax=Haemophilus sputorum TaxID=1078480 RepID=A0ABX9HTA5_9PAST|nr:pilus assembly protein PilP [Haemophilus sputorum]RDF09660.1 pilus assembly protein PilP [Haemophilus sputorum]RDF12818.1 pilus assembly protein PilP [Haemophilus sputorum]